MTTSSTKPKVKVPMWLKFHNSTCPGWLLHIGGMRKMCVGCKAMTKLEAENK